jgi:hypothetical protein
VDELETERCSFNLPERTCAYTYVTLHNILATRITANVLNISHLSHKIKKGKAVYGGEGRRVGWFEGKKLPSKERLRGMGNPNSGSRNGILQLAENHNYTISVPKLFPVENIVFFSRDAQGVQSWVMRGGSSGASCPEWALHSTAPWPLWMERRPSSAIWFLSCSSVTD